MIPFKAQRLDHLVLRVRDLEASVNFYVNVLGCKVARRRDDLGLIHIQTGTSMIDLVSTEGPLGKKGGPAPAAGARNLDHLCLRVEPFDETVIRRHLAEHNVQPSAPATVNFGAEGDGLSLYIQDPDGNVVELKGPASVSTGKAQHGTSPDPS
jgi:catechol 2,3-dioxygenase-like lactoylglutathione lyase family enzyme